MKPSVVELQELARRLVQVRGVRAVAMGGSRARGTAGPDSDTDLGLYVDGDTDLGALRALAHQVGGPTAQLTGRGQWGPVVDGGGWLDINDSPVDWLYRDVSRVADSVADARAGRITWTHQTGHPLGVPSVAYAAEVALGVPLADPDGLLAEARQAIDPYPVALIEAFIAELAEGGLPARCSVEAGGTGRHRLRRRHAAPRGRALCARGLRPGGPLGDERQGSGG